MRLMLEALHVPESEMPPEIADWQLNPSDLALDDLRQTGFVRRDHV
ncbi:MAG: hypothetical protein R2856_32855 [Caldilineaceae bacterium]